MSQSIWKELVATSVGLLSSVSFPVALHMPAAASLGRKLTPSRARRWVWDPMFLAVGDHACHALTSTASVLAAVLGCFRVVSLGIHGVGTHLVRSELWACTVSAPPRLTTFRAPHASRRACAASEFPMKRRLSTLRARVHTSGWGGRLKSLFDPLRAVRRARAHPLHARTPLRASNCELSAPRPGHNTEKHERFH